MNCRQCTDLLSSHLDGRTREDQRAELTAHIADCPSCGERLETMRRLSRALASPDGAPPADLAARLTRAAIAAGRESPEPGFIDRWLRVAWPSAAATAAAAAAFAIAVTGGAATTTTAIDDSSADPVAMLSADDDVDVDVAADVLALEEE